MSIKEALTDSHGRRINYLRLSITDHCNLKCMYCRGVDKTNYIPHAKILRFEQMIRLIRVLNGLGIGKARITGGEPFARKGCVTFLESLRQNFPTLRVSVTSNGTLLKQYITRLRALGLSAINISLDSLDPDDYASMSGQNCLPAVLNNIEELLANGIKVKINAVGIRGITEKSIPAFVEFAQKYDLDVRFIEFMPMGQATLWKPDYFISSASLIEIASQHADIHKLAVKDKFAGPAQMYSIAGSQGRLGFISAISSHFCGTCNRIRLTADGRLRTCLFGDKEYALKGALENKKIKDKHLAAIIKAACIQKPVGSTLLGGKKGVCVAGKNMSAIGG